MSRSALALRPTALVATLLVSSLVGVGACKPRGGAASASASDGKAKAGPTAPPTGWPRPPRVLSFQSTERPVTTLVVFLHGYGGEANNGEGLGRVFAASVPGVDVLVPDGIEPWEGGPSGRQWFGLREGPERVAGARRAAAAVSAWIDGELAERHLGHERVIIAGFSQGAMLAEWLAVERKPSPLAAIAFSGQFLVDDPVEATRTTTPLLVIHGTADTRIPVARAEEAERALRARGAPVELLVLPGLGHAIDARASQRALGFLQAQAATSHPR